ncbi:MAG: GNAT family N-acetyltransferase [Candidatus Sulfotelmatobacter sp.]
MNIQIINPLLDLRWDDLVARHPHASAFHQRGWLDALSRTYGYQPLVFTSASGNEPLEDGIVFCRVSSWITGTRLVSLPFSDHCNPLLNDPGEFREFTNRLRADRDCQRWKYVELRPLSRVHNGNHGLAPSKSYCFHELDLTPRLEQIFRGLHRDSIQRRIQRAEREGLLYENGRSEDLVEEFYRLLLITRRRHHLLPQPRLWLKNLMECLGDNVEIRVARKDSTPVAAMLTLRHRSSVIYKYGCSDEKLHNMGGMPFLFWRLIEESKASGVEKIDFGRSDLDQKSLIAFKDKFGTSKKLLHYYRYPKPEVAERSGWDVRMIRQFFSILPDSVSTAAGQVLYRHIG